ncbi:MULTISPECIES: hypothetical protein [unclassified Streptomyces]|uniref:hypothetical protein n=1 Tax=unclassified Streptomyces TaxID=2593676 RepID=UPI0037F79C1D
MERAVPCRDAAHDRRPLGFDSSSELPPVRHRVPPGADVRTAAKSTAAHRKATRL